MDYSRRVQEIFLVLFALDDLGGIRKRQEVVDHISRRRWYEVIGEDLIPTRTSREARYRIDLAWARKDGVLGQMINNLERNSWELNRKGKDTLEQIRQRFRSGKLDVGSFEFFTIDFKRLLVPDYEPKPTDKKRVRHDISILDLFK